MKKAIFSIVLTCFILTIIALYYIIYEIQSTSMLPRIKPKCYVIINPLVQNYQRWDIVGFKSPINPEELWVSRIIGMPNESITLSNGTVYINNNAINVPVKMNWLNYSTANNPKTDHNAVKYPYAIQKDSYFLICDNPNSLDSRYYGSVGKSNIKGKILER